MRDLMRFTTPNSEHKTFGGDFRQILSVITKGTRQDIVLASINSSYLWNSCKVLRLTKKLRLRSLESNAELVEIEAFSKWIASIGDGTIGGPNDSICKIDIPDEFLIDSTGDHIANIVDITFPVFRGCSTDPSFLEGPKFLNGLRCSSLPNHALTLKIGSPVMLLRNIDHSMGLCNGTRLIITGLADHVLEAKIMSGNHVGTLVLIPRMTLTSSDVRLPFKFQRRQFPLMFAYAMTINKSQGQNLSHVGLFLKKPIFNHGQLYVALSRVSNPRGLKILALDEFGVCQKTTTNVVYNEVFNNL